MWMCYAYAALQYVALVAKVILVVPGTTMFLPPLALEVTFVSPSFFMIKETLHLFLPRHLILSSR